MRRCLMSSSAEESRKVFVIYDTTMLPNQLHAGRKKENCGEKLRLFRSSDPAATFRHQVNVVDSFMLEKLFAFKS